MTEKDKIDWSLATWKGSRRHQHQEFHALSFAEKLACIEELNELAAQFSGKTLAELNEQTHRARRNRP